MFIPNIRICQTTYMTKTKFLTHAIARLFGSPKLGVKITSRILFCIFEKKKSKYGSLALKNVKFAHWAAIVKISSSVCIKFNGTKKSENFDVHPCADLYILMHKLLYRQIFEFLVWIWGLYWRSFNHIWLLL